MKYCIENNYADIQNKKVFDDFTKYCAKKGNIEMLKWVLFID